MINRIVMFANEEQKQFCYKYRRHQCLELPLKWIGWNGRKYPPPFCVKISKLVTDGSVEQDADKNVVFISIVEDAIQSQRNLGHNFFLRGYLAREWLTVIQHSKKDKPEEKFIHLYIELWRSLFAAVWEQRNATLHSESSLADKYEREKMTNELLKWKRVSHLRLGHQQQYLTEYNEEELGQWKTTTMRETVKLLVKTAHNLVDDMSDHNQQRITEYFAPMNLDED